MQYIQGQANSYAQIINMPAELMIHKNIFLRYQVTLRRQFCISSKKVSGLTLFFLNQHDHILSIKLTVLKKGINMPIRKTNLKEPSIFLKNSITFILKRISYS